MISFCLCISLFLKFILISPITILKSVHVSKASPLLLHMVSLCSAQNIRLRFLPFLEALCEIMSDCAALRIYDSCSMDFVLIRLSLETVILETFFFYLLWLTGLTFSRLYSSFVLGQYG